MTRTQIQRSVVLVLLLVAFLFLWMMTRRNAAQGSRPAGSRQMQPTPSPERKVEPQPGSFENPGNPGEVSIPSRDPFRLPVLLQEQLRRRQIELDRERKHSETPGSSRPAPPPASLPKLELQGIVWGTPKPQVIINRQILSVGDTIQEARIVAVTREGVMVSSGGQEVLLKLPGLRGQSSSEKEDFR